LSHPRHRQVLLYHRFVWTFPITTPTRRSSLLREHSHILSSHQGPLPVSNREPTRTPREVLALIREREVKAIDLRFMDFPGLWKHFTVPAEVMDENVFEDGIGFDGSGLRGWHAINEPDMLLLPQADTAFIDPFCQDVTLAMMQCGMTVESHHHEKATGGQCAINIRYDDLVAMADNVLKYKYVVKNVARRHGKTATFMPKPLFDDYGSGMHVHMSLWKKE